MADKKKMSLGKKILIGIGILLALGAIGNAMDDDDDSSPTTTEPAKVTGIGEVLQTQYFEVGVAKVDIRDRVGTGNQFVEPPADGSTYFVVLEVGFRNTDTESRMITDGSLFVNYNGKEYEFDHSETIMLDGWGTSLEQVNPLITFATRIVYRVPKELTGAAYWQPGRAYGENQRIYIGDL